MSTPHNIALINLRALTGIELAYLLREQNERNDIGAYAAVKAIAEEIARRQMAAEGERR